MGTLLYVECSVCKIKTFFPTSNVEGERLKNIMKKGQTRPQDFFNLNRHVVIAGLEKKAIEKDQDRVTRAEYKQNQATKERRRKLC